MKFSLKDVIPSRVFPYDISYIIQKLQFSSLKPAERPFLNHIKSKPPFPLQIGILFMISDQEIGLSPDAIPKLFIHFSQADTSTLRHFRGTGLGLAICK